MNSLELKNVGKRFPNGWVFRHINLKIEKAESLAITGKNGSGKSTLLKIMSGFSEPSEGEVIYANEFSKKNINTSTCYLSGPYVELIEELTLYEHIKFHGTFRKPLVTYKEIISKAGLLGSEEKVISTFSSGMKQRLKLSLAFYYESDFLFLDEPTANLDEQGIEWYRNEIIKLIGFRNLLIASNQRYEYDFLTNTVDLTSFQ